MKNIYISFDIYQKNKTWVKTSDSKHWNHPLQNDYCWKFINDPAFQVTFCRLLGISWLCRPKVFIVSHSGCTVLGPGKMANENLQLLIPSLESIVHLGCTFHTAVTRWAAYIICQAMQQNIRPFLLSNTKANQVEQNKMSMKISNKKTSALKVSAKHNLTLTLFYLD